MQNGGGLYACPENKVYFLYDFMLSAQMLLCHDNLNYAFNTRYIEVLIHKLIFI